MKFRTYKSAFGDRYISIDDLIAYLNEINLDIRNSKEFPKAKHLAFIAVLNTITEDMKELNGDETAHAIDIPLI